MNLGLKLLLLYVFVTILRNIVISKHSNKHLNVVEEIVLLGQYLWKKMMRKHFSLVFNVLLYYYQHIVDGILIDHHQFNI